MPDLKTFYTYFWLREDGTPYYVGKGRGRRAFRKGSPSHERILIQDFLSEADAFEAEKFLISCYGRKDLGAGCLRNRTDGGEGFSGGHWVCSEDFRLNISRTLKGNKRRLGHKHSPETIAKMSKSRTGKKLSEKHRQSLCGKGRIFSDESRKKMSESAKRYIVREGKEHYFRMSKLGAQARWGFHG